MITHNRIYSFATLHEIGLRPALDIHRNFAIPQKLTSSSDFSILLSFL